jgi:hypothetical protein
MKRVLSVRVSYETIAQCYELVSAGANPRALNLSSVVIMALEAMLEGLARHDKIKRYSEAEALNYIAEFIPKEEWPGVDMSSVELGEILQERQDKEKRRDKETAQVTENAPPEAETATENDTEELHTYGVPSAVFRDNTQSIEERRAILMSNIETELAAIEQAESAELETVASVGEVYRVSPDIEPVVKPQRAPWEGVALARERDIKEDKLYQAALTVDAEMVLALKVVYAALSKEVWGTEKAIELIQATYKTFKEYKEGLK